MAPLVSCRAAAVQVLRAVPSIRRRSHNAVVLPSARSSVVAFPGRSVVSPTRRSLYPPPFRWIHPFLMPRLGAPHHPVKTDTHTPAPRSPTTRPHPHLVYSRSALVAARLEQPARTPSHTAAVHDPVTAGRLGSSCESWAAPGQPALWSTARVVYGSRGSRLVWFTVRGWFRRSASRRRSRLMVWSAPRRTRPRRHSREPRRSSRSSHP
jgi:hypothetical protein